MTTHEPERRVIPRSDVPPPDRMNLAKGYWDSVVRHLLLLGRDEVMAIDMPPGHAYSGRTSLNGAAAKAGVRVSIVFRGDVLYAWSTGRRMPSPKAVPPRKPIRCRVCDRTVIRPRTGGSVQYYCGPEGGKRSVCLYLAKFARDTGISIAEAKLRSPRWQRERGAQRRPAA